MCFKLQEGQETWHAYLDYIDSLVVDGLLYTVACSIGFLLDETDPTLTQVRFAPLPQTSRAMKGSIYF